ncbi:MAG: aminotransferase class III-fold pyridoxal phosphate-dependent enzyme, partial [Deltaproteobacteria bacterium]|nr:aminotransferase class III-fold pyridoxal phosphate-dependent enzyme [Deltaproteobacteria bacterium]
MPHENTLETLFSIAEDTLRVRPHQLSPDKLISELGLDPADARRLSSEILARLGKNVPEGRILDERLTFGELSAYLDTLPAEPSPGPGEGPKAAAQDAPLGPAFGDPEKPPLAAGPGEPQDPASAPMELFALQIKAMYDLFARQWGSLGAALPFKLPPLSLPGAPEGAPVLGIGAGQAPASQAQGPPAKPPSPARAPSRVTPAARKPLDGAPEPQPLTQRQESFVAELVRRFQARTTQSRAMAGSGAGLLGLGTPVRAIPRLEDAALPMVVRHSAGAHFMDLDGNDYLDFSQAMGYLGHNPRYVAEAMAELGERGFATGAVSDTAFQAAKSLLKVLGMRGRVSFWDSPASAVWAGILLARLGTGRPLCATLTDDPIWARAALAAQGEPGDGRPGILSLDYGSKASLSLIHDRIREVAAIVLEPVRGREPGYQPASYLGQLRKLAREGGAVLIFDETAMGPAFLPGGSGGALGVEPDLAVHGPGLSGGIPVGILAGDPEVLGLLSDPRAQAMLPGGPANPLALAAVRATAERLLKDNESLKAKAGSLARSLTLRLNLWFQDELAPFRLLGFGPHFAFVPYGPYATPKGMLETELFYLLLLEFGIFAGDAPAPRGGEPATRPMAVSALHSQEDLRRLEDAAAKAVAALREGGFAFTLPKGAPRVFSSLSQGRRAAFAGYLREGGQLGRQEAMLFRLQGKAPVQSLSQALSQLPSRHAALNFGVWGLGDELYGRVEDESAFRLALMSDYSSESYLEAAQPLLAPYELDRAPLARAAVIDRGDHFLFALTSLSGAIDRESLGILLSDIKAVMGRRQPPQQAGLREAWSELGAFLKSPREGADRDRRGESLAYWASRLSGQLDLMPFPVDNPLLRESLKGRGLHEEIGGAPLERYRDRLSRLGFTPELFFTGVLGLALQKFMVGAHFVVGRRTTGRLTPKTFGQVGSFAYYHPLEINASRAYSQGDLEDLVANERAALDHMYATESELREGIGRQPFDVALAWHGIPPDLLDLPGLKPTWLPLFPPGGSPLCRVAFSEEKGLLHLNLSVSESVSPKALKALAGYLLESFREFAADTHLPPKGLGSIPAPGARPWEPAGPGTGAPAEGRAPSVAPDVPGQAIAVLPGLPAPARPLPAGAEAQRQPEALPLPEDSPKQLPLAGDPFLRAEAAGKLGPSDLEAIRDVYGDDLALCFPATPSQEGLVPHNPRPPISIAESRRFQLEAAGEAFPEGFLSRLKALKDGHDAFRLRQWQGAGGTLNVLLRTPPALSDICLHEGLEGLSPANRERRVQKVQDSFERRIEGMPGDGVGPGDGSPPGGPYALAPGILVGLFRHPGHTYEILLSNSRLALDPESATLVLSHLIGATELGNGVPFSEGAEALEAEKAARGPGCASFWEGGLSSLSALTKVQGRIGGEKTGHRALSVPNRLDPEFSDALGAAAAKAGTGVPAFLGAAFALLLSRMTLEGEVTFLSDPGRPPGAPPSGLGPYSSMLPITLAIEPGAPFGKIAADYEDRASKASAHGLLSLGELAAMSRLGKDSWSHFFLYEGGISGKDGPAIRKLKELCALGHCPLGLVARGPGPLELFLVYSEGAYPAWQVEVMALALHNLLRDALADPGAHAGSLRLSEPHQDLSLVRQNNAKASKPAAGTVMELVRARAAERPGALAVTQADFMEDYQTLDKESDKFAAQLKVGGFGPGKRVALIFDDATPEYPSVLLGVLKSGATAVPLSAGIPPKELSLLLRDATPSLLVCGERMPRNLLAQDRLEVPVVDPRGRFLLGGSSGVMGFSKFTSDFVRRARDEVRVDPDSPAYLIYVSGRLLGRAGQGADALRERGVLVSHRALLNLVSWAGDYLSVAHGDTHSTYAPLSSDVSLMEILTPLASGATLLLLSNQDYADEEILWETIHSHKVSSLSLPLRKLRQYLSRYPLFGLKTIVTWGRGLSGDNVSGLIGRGAADTRIVNCFGQPECAVASLAEAAHPGQIPETMGRPVPNTPSYVLDREGRLLPAGFPGELHVGGCQVALGYHGNPGGSDKAFVPDPFAALSPPEYHAARLFRTGILARRRPDGRLDYLGRLGQKTVVRGLSVPVAEVERALLSATGVLEALVVKREGPSPYSEPYLAAYLTMRDKEGLGHAARIRKHLELRLPAFAIPERIAILNEFPLDPFGRVDVSALPDPEALEEPAAAPGEGQRAQGPQSLPSPLFFGEGEDPFSLAPSSLSQGDREEIARHYGGFLGKVLPLSSYQLAFLDRAAREGKLQGVAAVTRLTVSGSLDPALLAQRLEAMIASSDAFRMSFFETERGAPVAVLSRRAPALRDILREEDLRSADTRKREARIAASEASHLAALRDASRAPLARVTLLRLGDDLWELVASFHHMVFDLHSRRLFLERLFFRGADSSPTWLSFMEKRLARDPAANVAYWREALSALERPARLPELPGAGEGLPEGASLREQTRLRLKKDLSDRLRARAAEAGVPVDDLLLAAWAVVLGRAAREDTLVVGRLLSGREPGCAGLLGPAGVIAPLVVKAPPTKPFSELAREVAGLRKSAERHDGVNLAEVRALSPIGQDTVSHTFSYRMALGLWGLSPGLRVLSLRESSHTLFPLSVSWEERDNLEADFIYDPRRFLPWQVNAYSEATLAVLSQVAQDPSLPVGGILVASPQQGRALILAETQRDEDFPGLTFADLFGRWANLGPQLPAVAAQDQTLSYGELDSLSAAVAKSLLAMGLAPASRCALLFGRDIRYVPALIGALRAGAAAVPLPTLRLDGAKAILSDARPEALVTTPDLLAELEAQEGMAALLGGVGVIGPDGGILREGPSRAGPEATLPQVSPDAAAYVVYVPHPEGGGESPVGVEVSHRALHNHVSWFSLALDLRNGDTQAAYAPFTMDASLMEILNPLSCGARVRILSEREISDLDQLANLARTTLSSLWLPSRLFLHFAESYDLGGLKTLFTTAVGLPQDATPMERSATRLLTTLGFPECAMASAAETAAPGRLPETVGLAGPNCRSYVLDRLGDPLPPGFPGELYLGGAQVGMGYLGRPELTQAFFVRDPFEAAAGGKGKGTGRLFRTGLLVLRRPDGRLDFLGALERSSQAFKAARFDGLAPSGLAKGPSGGNAPYPDPLAPPGEAPPDIPVTLEMQTVEGREEEERARALSSTLPALPEAEGLPEPGPPAEGPEGLLEKGGGEGELALMGISGYPEAGPEGGFPEPDAAKRDPLSPDATLVAGVEGLEGLAREAGLAAPGRRGASISSGAKAAPAGTGARELLIRPQGDPFRDSPLGARDRERIRSLYGDNLEKVLPATPMQLGIASQLAGAKRFEAFLSQFRLDVTGLSYQDVLANVGALGRASDVTRMSLVYQGVSRPVRVYVSKEPDFCRESDGRGLSERDLDALVKGSLARHLGRLMTTHPGPLLALDYIATGPAAGDSANGPDTAKADAAEGAKDARGGPSCVIVFSVHHIAADPNSITRILSAILGGVKPEAAQAIPQD